MLEGIRYAWIASPFISTSSPDAKDTGMNRTRAIWQSIWRILGAVPLWTKIMGIVVLPLSLLMAGSFLYARSAISNLLQDYGYLQAPEELPSSLTHQAILTIIIIILVGIPLALLLTRSLTRPLQRLIETIHQVEEGDLSARVEVWAQDEIGQVQESFNTMIANLEAAQEALLRSNQELQALNEIAERIALAKEPNTILNAAIEHAAKLLKADVGLIYLLDNGKTELQIQAAYRRYPLKASQYVEGISISDWVVQRAFQNRQPTLIEARSSLGSQPSPILEMIRSTPFSTAIAVPIRALEKNIGILLLFTTAQHPIKTDRLPLFEAIGNLIGVGLTNIQLVEDLERKEKQLRQALHRAVTLQEEERKRLARELHDGAGQALASILIRLKALYDENEKGNLIDRIEGLRYLTAETLEELRRLALDLRPAALDNLGILPALKWYLERCIERKGVKIEFHGPKRLERLPSEIEVALYRIAQEGVTNAIRHGKPNLVEVLLERGPHCIWLSILDDGLGFASIKQANGLGLIGIQERVSILGGKAAIESQVGAGTKIWVEIPLPEDQTSHD